MQILLYFLILSFLTICFGQFINQESCSIFDSPENVNFNIILPVSDKFYHLEEKLLDISNPKSINYRKYLPIDYIQYFSQPSEEIRQPVINWLNNNSIDCIDFGDSFKCKSSIQKASEIWKLKTGMVRIPSSLNNKIMFVEGLNIKHLIKKQIKSINKKYSSIQPDSGYVGLEVLRKLYQIPEVTVDGSIASIEYQGDSGFSQSDLDTNNQLNGLKSNKVNNIVGTDTMADTETELDLQMESIVANGAEVWFWDDDGWLLSFATNFFNTKKVPSVISMSWGWAEDQQCQITACNNLTSREYVNRVNQEYIQIGLRGISILVASGDAGAPGRTAESCDESRAVNPVMPGSSPWVTSVSASFVSDSNEKTNNWETSLCKKFGCASGKLEIPTNFNWTGWTTGGGFSIYNSRPYWQTEVVSKYLSSHIPLPENFNSKGRGYPDVTAIGHNCPVIQGNQISPVDGTSCSSPVFAGMVAILNHYESKKGKPNLGFLNPLLYQMYQENASIFNDITIGNNYCTEYNCCPNRSDGGSDFGYLSTKGWDPVTGLGSPNIKEMLNYLDQKN